MINAASSTLNESKYKHFLADEIFIGSKYDNWKIWAYTQFSLDVFLRYTKRWTQEGQDST